MNVSRRTVVKAGGGAALYSALASIGFFAANPAMAAWKKIGSMPRMCPIP